MTLLWCCLSWKTCVVLLEDKDGDFVLVTLLLLFFFCDRCLFLIFLFLFFLLFFFLLFFFLFFFFFFFFSFFS